MESRTQSWANRLRVKLESIGISVFIYPYFDQWLNFWNVQILKWLRFETEARVHGESNGNSKIYFFFYHMWQNIFVMRRTKLYSVVRISSILSWFRWYNWFMYFLCFYLFIFWSMIVLLNCLNSIMAEIRDWSKSPRRIQWNLEFKAEQTVRAYVTKYFCNEKAKTILSS